MHSRDEYGSLEEKGRVENGEWKRKESIVIEGWRCVIKE